MAWCKHLSAQRPKRRQAAIKFVATGICKQIYIGVTCIADGTDAGLKREVRRYLEMRPRGCDAVRQDRDADYLSF